MTQNKGVIDKPSPSDDHQRLVLAFDDNRLASLVFGDYDSHLAHLERRLGIQATAFGNHVTLEGSKLTAEQGRKVLETLYTRARRGETLTMGDIDGVIEEMAIQGSLFPGEVASADSSFAEIVTRRRGVVRARTRAQDQYLRALKKKELVFAEGPAGSGKTWLAVGHAVMLLEQGLVERLVLSRPAVEAGERLGFLPGDMRDKVDPYLRPIYDALYDFMEPRAAERALQTGMIEVAPLAFMRGRTLSRAVVLLDEAQNCTVMQMKMFLTRLGQGSRMIITGDSSQIDLPRGERSGLRDAMEVLQGLDAIAQIKLTEADVVRHDLVRQIVTAYGAREKTSEG